MTLVRGSDRLAHGQDPNLLAPQRHDTSIGQAGRIWLGLMGGTGRNSAISFDGPKNRFKPNFSQCTVSQDGNYIRPVMNSINQLRDRS